MTVADDLATLVEYARLGAGPVDRRQREVTVAKERVEAEIARLEEQRLTDAVLIAGLKARAEKAERYGGQDQGEIARLRDGLESADRLLRAVPIDRLAPVTKRIVGEARAAIARALLTEDGAGGVVGPRGFIPDLVDDPSLTEDGAA